MSNSNTVNTIKDKIIAAGLSVATSIMAIVPAYSDPFEQATNATKSLMTKIVDLCKVLFPFSLVLLIVAILFTHDQKALQFELKTALIICVAYIALLIVADGGFADFFSTLI